MGQLFDPPERQHVPRQQGGPIELGGFGATERVLSTANPHLLVVHAVIDVDGTSGAEPHALEAAAEFAYLISGRLHVFVGDHRYELGSGDALTFPAQDPHRWVNPGPDPVEVLWVLALPPR
jgi:mannose-6-phosphate isomerase-like protein (cupin superfamily)